MLDVCYLATEGPAAASEVQPLVGGHAGLVGEVHLVAGRTAFASAKAGLLGGVAGDVILTDDAHVSGKIFVEPVGLIGAGASYEF